MAVSFISNELQQLGDLTAPDVARESIPDKAADYLGALDTLDQVREERKVPALKSYLRSMAAGAVGAGLGTAVKIPIIDTKAGTDPSVMGPAVGVMSGAGAGMGALATFLRRHSMARRTRNANQAIEETPAWIRRQAKDPEIAQTIEDYRNSRLHPLRGAEIGFLLGGVGGAAYGSRSVPEDATTAEKWLTAGRDSTIGATAAAGTGLLLGLLLRRKARSRLVKQLQSRLSGQAKTAIHRTIRMRAHNLAKQRQEGLVRNETPGRPHPGQPVRPDGNHIQQDQPERYSAGLMQDPYNFHERTEEKTAAFLQGQWEKHAPPFLKLAYELEAGLRKQAANAPKLRSRAEVISLVYDGDTPCAWAIDKSDYILFPGGGIDDGETAEMAVLRETAEEAGRKVGNLDLQTVKDAIHPPDKPLMPGFDGERSYIYIGADAGESGGTHPDREEFKKIPLAELEVRLRRLIKKGPEWAEGMNGQRLQAVKQVEARKDTLASLKKLADAVVLQPRTDYLAFDPAGRLLIRRGQHRSLEFPTQLPEGVKAEDVPYTEPQMVIPDAGVPEQGYHGYRVGLQSATVPTIEGYEAVEPNAALKELYAAMGRPENKSYLGLNRARAQAILRLLKKRRAMTPPDHAPAATPPHL